MGRAESGRNGAGGDAEAAPNNGFVASSFMSLRFISNVGCALYSATRPSGDGGGGGRSINSRWSSGV